MSKRYSFLLFLFCITFFSVQAESANFESRVAVLPIFSLEEDSRFGSVCSAIDDTVLLTLKLLGKYDVIDGTGFDKFSEEDIFPYAEEKNIDNVIFGTVFQDEDGSINIEMSVWDRQQRKIVLAVKERAEMLFDIFDASDLIVVSLIEGFSGKHIGYGSITLEPIGKDADFFIELNGTFAGINRKEMRNVLIGNYDLTIKQNRLFGNHILYSDNIEVSEKETTLISFDLPNITDEEVDFFNSIDKEIIQGWTDPNQEEEIIFRLEDTISLLTGYEGYFADQRVKYEDMLIDIVNKRRDILDVSIRSAYIRNAKNMVSDVNSLIPEVFTSTSSNIREGNFPLIGGKFFVYRVSYINYLQKALIPVVSRGEIRVDGRRDDWILLPAILKDKQGDGKKDGSDIISVKIARDESRIYTLISMDGDSVYSSDDVWYQSFFNTDYGNINLTFSYWDGAWHAYISKWVHADWNSQQLADGTVMRGRGFLEGSFPLSVLIEHLGTEEEYQIQAQIGSSSGQLDCVTASAYLKIGDY